MGQLRYDTNEQQLSQLKPLSDTVNAENALISFP